MKKILFLFLPILLNLNCSSQLKSIDRKVNQIEKQITKKNIKKNDYSDHTKFELSEIIYATKIGTEIVKINYEIVENENYSNYNRKCQIYLKKSVPIFITEIISGKQTIYFSGINKVTKEPANQMDMEFAINNKIYVENWKKFEIDVIGSSKKNDYNLKSKEEYEKIINKVLKQETKK